MEHAFARPLPAQGWAFHTETSLRRLVGFIFAFRICFTLLFFKSDAAEGTAVTAALNVGLFLATLLYWLMTLPAGRTRNCYPQPIKWVGVYLIMAAISLYWTTVPSIAAASVYWIALAVDVLTVLLLMQHRSEAEAAYLMQGYVVGAVAVSIIAWYLPGTADLRLGDEEFLHPNAIGFELAIASLLAMYLSRHSRIWRWIGFGLAITLLRTLSKTSIAAFIIAGVFYLLQDSAFSRKARVGIGVGTIAVVAAFWTALESYADIYTQGQNLETVTGRTVIWATSLDIALEKPWLGHGFYSFRWVVPLFGNFEAWQAHNELLQQFFAYGLVGLVVVAALYWNFYRQVRSVPTCHIKTLASSLLIFALARGLVDTERFDLSFPLWLLTLLSVAFPIRAAVDLP